MTAARHRLAVELDRAGVAGVTLDPGALPPYVLVDLIRFTPPAQGIGSWPGSVVVRVVVPPPGDATAAAALETTTTNVLRALGFPQSGIPTTVELNDGKPNPAYELTYPIDVPNPDC